MEKKNINVIFVFCFVFSFGVALYGAYLIYSYEYEVKKSVVEVEEKVLEEEIIGEVNGEHEVEQVEEKTDEVVKKFENDEDSLGVITFKNGKKVAIYNNPSDYNMDRGIGKLINNAILNESGNSILLGHRETGMYELRNVEVGDVIEVKTSKKIVRYKVVSTYVVSKDDPNPYKSTSDLRITLITCYPFIYNGNAPKRFVVVGSVIE